MGERGGRNRGLGLGFGGGYVAVVGGEPGMGQGFHSRSVTSRERPILCSSGRGFHSSSVTARERPILCCSWGKHWGRGVLVVVGGG